MQMMGLPTNSSLEPVMERPCEGRKMRNAMGRNGKSAYWGPSI